MSKHIQVGSKFAVVDDEDYEWLSSIKWSLNHGYARRGPISMHRLIMNPGPGLEVDHINRNRLDNRRANLRNVTHSENCLNRAPRPRKQYPIGKRYVRERVHLTRTRMHFKETDDTIIAQLDALAKREGTTRATLIRRAIRMLLFSTPLFPENGPKTEKEAAQ